MINLLNYPGQGLSDLFIDGETEARRGPPASQVTGAAGTSARMSRRPVRTLLLLPAPPARPACRQHPSPLWVNGRYPPPFPPQPPTAGAEGGTLGSRKEGGARHLQFTLQSTVQSQWQKQKQWKVHSLLTITGRPLGAVPEARSSHPGHLPLLPLLPGSCSGKPILGRPSDGLHASIFNAASQLTYQNPPVYPIPGSPGGPGRVCQRKPPATLSSGPLWAMG